MILYVHRSNSLYNHLKVWDAFQNTDMNVNIVGYRAERLSVFWWSRDFRRYVTWDKICFNKQSNLINRWILNMLQHRVRIDRYEGSSIQNYTLSYSKKKYRKTEGHYSIFSFPPLFFFSLSWVLRRRKEIHSNFST